MKKMVNNTEKGNYHGVWGYLYEVEATTSTPEERLTTGEEITSSTLCFRKTGAASKNPGTLYIGGAIKVATDEDCTNIVEIRYPYVTEFYRSGKPNFTYAILKKIILGEVKTVMNSSKDEALKIKCTPSINVQSYYKDGVNSDEPELVNFKTLEGGFITEISNFTDAPDDPSKRASFEVDMLITTATEVETEEEHKVLLKGVIFDYAKRIMPVEFVVREEGGINYFLNCDITPSNPLFTMVRGKIISTVIKRQVTEVGAWGEPIVSNYSTTRKEWEVYWCLPEAYEYPDEDTLTPEDIQACMQDREMLLAAAKQRYLDKKNHSTPAAARPIITDGFNF